MSRPLATRWRPLGGLLLYGSARPVRFPSRMGWICKALNHPAPVAHAVAAELQASAIARRCSPSTCIPSARHPSHCEKRTSELGHPGLQIPEPQQSPANGHPQGSRLPGRSPWIRLDQRYRHLQPEVAPASSAELAICPRFRSMETSASNEGQHGRARRSSTKPRRPAPMARAAAAQCPSAAGS